MKTFFLQILRKVFQKKDAKKLNKFYNFLLKHESTLHIKEEDIIYPLSFISSHLNFLKRGVIASSAFSLVPSKEEGKVSKKGENKWNKRENFMEIEKSKLIQFLQCSEKYTNDFFTFYLKRVLQKKQEFLSIKFFIYLLDCLFLFNLETQIENYKRIFEKVLVAIIVKNETYFRNTQPKIKGSSASTFSINDSNINRFNDNYGNSIYIDTSQILELLLIINRHKKKFEKIQVNFHLLFLFYLHLFNFLFHHSIFLINEEKLQRVIYQKCCCSNIRRSFRNPVRDICFEKKENEEKRTDNLETEGERTIIYSQLLLQDEMSVEKIIQFYKCVYMSKENFINIIFFLKKNLSFWEFFVFKKGNTFCSKDIVISNVYSNLLFILSYIFYDEYLQKEKKKVFFCSSQNNQKVRENKEANYKESYKDANYFISVMQKKNNNFISAIKTDINRMILEIFFEKYSRKEDRPTDNKSLEYIFHHIIVQNNISNIQLINFIHTSKNIKYPFHLIYHFNRRVYNLLWIYRFYSLLKNESNTDLLLSETLFLFSKVIHFLLKFYAPVLYTNNLIGLLSLAVTEREAALQEKRILNEDYISIINEEIIRRFNKKKWILHKNDVSSSISISFSSYDCDKFNQDTNIHEIIHPFIDFDKKDTSFILFPFFYVNIRHLCNLCNYYSKVNFHDQRFIEIIKELVLENFNSLKSKDIASIIFFLEKANYRNKTVLQLLLKNLEQNIIHFQLNEIHLILKSMFQLQFIFLKYIRRIVHFLFFFIFSLFYLTRLEVARTLSNSSHLQKHNFYSFHSNDTYDTLCKFAESVNSLYLTYSRCSGKKILPLKKGMNIFIEEISIESKEKEQKKKRKKKQTEKECVKVTCNKDGELDTPENKRMFLYVREPDMQDIFRNMLKKPLDENIKNILNILYVLSTYKIKNKILFDSFYILIKENYEFLKIADVANLIISHCKIKYNPSYLNSYILKFCKFVKDKEKEKNTLSSFDISIFVFLCHGLKDIEVEQKMRVFDFFVRNVTPYLLLPYQKSLIKAAFRKVNHEKWHLFN